MKAVIMAGGKGSRLRPITSEVPKPLCTLLGKPVIVHILDLLKQNGAEEAAITLGYLGNRIEETLAGYSGMELHFSHEDTPLGTAGGVKKAAQNFSDDFIVLSGDAMCDFDLQAAYAFHQKKKAAATLIVHRVADPREYGLVCSDSDGRVTSFVEKPSFAGCVTDRANTGIYIISPKVLELIDDEGESDFAKDVFPRMLEKGMPIYCVEEKGYWCDIGDVKSYLTCQEDILSGKVKVSVDAAWENNILRAWRRPPGNYTVHPPIYIGENVSIGKDTVIEAGTVLEDNVQVGAGCRIEKSVLMTGAVIGNRVVLRKAAVCADARLEDGVSAAPYSVVGTGALLKRDTSVEEGVRVWGHRTVERNSVLRDDVRDEQTQGFLIEDDGVFGPTNSAITPEVCVKVGMGTASLNKKLSIGVGYSKKGASKAFAWSCISGIMASGANAWNFGECLQSQLAFCLDKSNADVGIYIDSGKDTTIRVFDRRGLPMPREMERKLERSIDRGEYQRASADEMGSVLGMASIAALYPYELLKSCGVSLADRKVRIQDCYGYEKILQTVLAWLGCEFGSGISIRISSNGKGAELSENGVGMNEERVLAAICWMEFLKGNPVALPRSAPHAIDAMAKEYQTSTYRYSEYPCGNDDKEARQLAEKQPFLRDGMMMTIRILSYLAEQKMTLAQLNEKIPPIFVSSRTVSFSQSPVEVLERLNGDNRQDVDGVELHDGEYTAVARPLKSGRGIRLFAESGKSETAEEICGRFESKIRGILDTDSFS